MWQYACCLLRISLIPSSQFSIMEHPIIIAPTQQVFSPHKSRMVAAVPLSKVDPGINYKSEGLCGREKSAKIQLMHPGGTHAPYHLVYTADACVLMLFILFSFVRSMKRKLLTPAACSAYLGLQPGVDQYSSS